MLDYVDETTRIFLQVSRNRFQSVKAIEVLETGKIVISHKGYTRPVSQTALATDCDHCDGEGHLYIDTTRKFDSQPSENKCECPYCEGKGLVMLENGNSDELPSYTRANPRRTGRTFVSGHLGW